MGRPKKPKKRSKTICIRVSEEEKDILEMISDYAGLTVSDLLRSLALSLILRFKLGLPITMVNPDVLETNYLPLSRKA